MNVGSRRELELFEALGEHPPSQSVSLNKGGTHLTADVALVSQLYALQAVGIPVDETDNLPRELALRIVAVGLIIQPHPFKIELLYFFRVSGSDLPLEPNERFFRRELLLDFNRIQAQDLCQSMSEDSRVCDPSRPRINGLRL